MARAFDPPPKRITEIAASFRRDLIARAVAEVASGDGLISDRDFKFSLMLADLAL